MVGALTLTACGGGDGEPVADASAEQSAPAAPAGQPAAAPAEGPATAAPDYGLVTPEEASTLAERGITVIDVRTPEEFAEGHIDGAALIDFYSDTFADQIAELDPDGEYLVYCRSGNRSGQAVGLMQELGFDQVYDMAGGVVAYAQAGLPLVR